VSFRFSFRFAAAFLLAYAFAAAPVRAGEADLVLRLATTTSTADSGLLGALLPEFEESHGVRVDVIAVGTGQALALGRAGDADVLLVHARDREEAFVAAGHGIERRDVMYNDFVIVGPVADTAGIREAQGIADALRRIAAAKAKFASRGDDSGTHTKEKRLWEAAGLQPDLESGWYRSLGQGMGSTLQFANEVDAYTLTDRGTFLAQRDRLKHLEVLVGGASPGDNSDPALFNPYGLVLVSSAKGDVNIELARVFADWLVSVPTQRRISTFGRVRHGVALFHPNSAVWQRALTPALP
jgi:tungstate transport system substrate-binding protein